MKSDKQQRSDNLASSLTECIDQIISTTPLIARLRSRQAFFRHDGEARWLMSTQPDLDCVEAAHEIERLELELATITGYATRLECALKHIANARIGEEVSEHIAQETLNTYPSGELSGQVLKTTEKPNEQS